MAEIVSILGLIIGSSGITGIVIAVLQRRWNKEDKYDALVQAQKVLMIDRVRLLGRRYIKDGEIDIHDKENLNDMHKAYKALGGNGHLDTIMHEVDRLRVVDKEAKP